MCVVLINIEGRTLDKLEIRKSDIVRSGRCRIKMNARTFFTSNYLARWVLEKFLVWVKFKKRIPKCTRLHTLCGIRFFFLVFVKSENYWHLLLHSYSSPWFFFTIFFCFQANIISYLCIVQIKKVYNEIKSGNCEPYEIIHLILNIINVLINIVFVFAAHKVILPFISIKLLVNFIYQKLHNVTPVWLNRLGRHIAPV